MLRFVVLTHDWPHLHWDFLVEMTAESALRSWRLEQPPEPGLLIRADALPDHRRLYLDYEGPISGNRGEVARWDFGEADICSKGPDEVTLEIRGQRIQGRAVLTRVAGDEWTFQLADEN